MIHHSSVDLHQPQSGGKYFQETPSVSAQEQSAITRKQCKTSLKSCKTTNFFVVKSLSILAMLQVAWPDEIILYSCIFYQVLWFGQLSGSRYGVCYFLPVNHSLYSLPVSNRAVWQSIRPFAFPSFFFWTKLQTVLYGGWGIFLLEYP